MNVMKQLGVSLLPPPPPPGWDASPWQGLQPLYDVYMRTQIIAHI